MFVSRSDVSFRDSIQRDSCVTGAKAIASSDDGSGALSVGDRTNRSVDGDARTLPCEYGFTGNIGFQIVAGKSVASSATFRGPMRRSRYGASDVRHESAACRRSAGVKVTCINFSASANVSGDTAGPVPAPVPN